jgi:hypothetical protein
MSTATRQPKGIPVGGQFAATSHADPSIQLQMLKESEEAFAFTPGTRVSTGNELGTISEAGKDKNGNVTVNLDGGGSLRLKADRLVPWEAYLDTVMPAVEYNPDPETTEIPRADSDRALRGSFVRMRNALDSASRTGAVYHHGIAFGEAEVAAALMDADADPETIGAARNEVLMLGLPLGAEHEALSPAAIKQRSAAPLTGLRVRRLAGYFTARAVEMQAHNGAIPQNDWGTAEWTKQGAMLSYSLAAVRFAGGLPHSEDTYHGERFYRLLGEGETNTDTIIGETFDEHAW